MDSKELSRWIEAALRCRENAYAPYSRFAVGAALVTAGGDLFTGCNIENASFGGTICAERVAASAAIAAGQRKWQAIVLTLSGGGPPCGICRQFLSEFAPDLRIYRVDADNPQREYQTDSLADLYPHPFSSRDL